MEYCSPLWAGAPASHLSRLHAVETKAFRIIGFSHDEAESLGLSLSHRRQVGGLSVFSRLLFAPPALSAICPHHISPGCSRSTSNPLLVKLPKSRITAHFHFHSSFFLPLEENSLTLFNPILPSKSSNQLFTTTSSPNPRSFLPTLIHPKPTSLKFPAFLPESPCSVHLVYPMFPTPSLSLPQIS